METKTKSMQDEVNEFLAGKDPMERIIKIECSYQDKEVSIIYYNSKGQKRVKKDAFKPFVWCKNKACINLCGGDRNAVKRLMNEYGIGVRCLKTKADGAQEEDERVTNGFKYIIYAKRPMSYQYFMSFFTKAGVPIYPKKKKGEEVIIETRDKLYLAVSPVEQYMISTSRRLFKGFESYDDIKRMAFDIETTGLNAKTCTIDQIGIRTNKGFERILNITGEGEERKRNELRAIEEWMSIIGREQPDVLFGHNSEVFDVPFLMTRCEMLGGNFLEMSKKYFPQGMTKKNKDTVLKIGGEVDYYKPTISWGYNIIDSLHAVRRAQAQDSSMKKANLKYVTKYLKLNKPNRVYVNGNHIGEIWRETSQVYAFNNKDGDYYRMTDEKPLREGYEPQSGKYIVERYLLDDIWETDKVELALNEANFLVSKILPTDFVRACTMGTAGIWKLILLGWSYENELAVPNFEKSKRFTGGLSRLLKTGYVDRIVKLDYNSLYPSIMLTWNVKSPLDFSNSILTMLEYVLTNRELYKDLKKKYGKQAESIEIELESFEGTEEEREKKMLEMAECKGLSGKNDKKQLPLKILGNSLFGSFGSPNLFPWGNTNSAEAVTCIGRQCLRLMINHFTKLGYTPIVGDSFTPDTPLFIKYDATSQIDIKPISELIDESQVKIDELGREYDTSKKGFAVLCRSGWMHPSYIYRHGTDKPIYRVSEGKMAIDVTEDHSLFNDKQEKIKPSSVTPDTKLEYKCAPDDTLNKTIEPRILEQMAKMFLNKTITRVPIAVLNATKGQRQRFLELTSEFNWDKQSKTLRAQKQFLER